MPVIELLGVPGSGKTTLARDIAGSVPGGVVLEEAVRSAMRSDGEDLVTRIAAGLSGSASSRIWRSAYGRSPDRFTALTRFLAAHPAALETVLAAQRQRAGRDRGQDLVLGWVLNLMSRYELATGPGMDGWLVIDEGFCQRGVAVFAYGFDPADASLLTSYLDAIPLPDVVVSIDVPPALAEQRLEQRGWSERVRDLDIEDRRRFLETSATVVESITSRLESSSTRLIRVDGTAPVPISLDRISASLTD